MTQKTSTWNIPICGTGLHWNCIRLYFLHFVLPTWKSNYTWVVTIFASHSERNNCPVNTKYYLHVWKTSLGSKINKPKIKLHTHYFRTRLFCAISFKLINGEMFMLPNNCSSEQLLTIFWVGNVNIFEWWKNSHILSQQIYV